MYYKAEEIQEVPSPQKILQEQLEVNIKTLEMYKTESEKLKSRFQFVEKEIVKFKTVCQMFEDSLKGYEKAVYYNGNNSEGHVNE